MAQQGDNYANDYSANYAGGNEMIDLNTRRRAALAEVMMKLIACFASVNSFNQLVYANFFILSFQIDNAKFGWFHIRACIVSGVGFFTDSYDIFAINLVSAMFGWIYFAPTHKTPYVSKKKKKLSLDDKVMFNYCK
jgi:hypothetical protein